MSNVQNFPFNATRRIQDNSYPFSLQQMPADGKVSVEQEIKKAIEEHDSDLYEINTKVHFISGNLLNITDRTFLN